MNAFRIRHGQPDWFLNQPAGPIEIFASDHNSPSTRRQRRHVSRRGVVYVNGLPVGRIGGKS